MKKRILSMLLAICFVVMLLPGFASAAATFTDMPNDYSTKALEAAVANGLLNGSNGKIMPNDKLTRAQMAAIISRAFGATEQASLTGFTDVSKSAWYFADIGKAVHMKTLNGYNGLMRPDDPISREEAFAVLARALKLKDGTAASFTAFSDKADVSNWAVGTTAAMIANGYVHGADGKIKPKDNIKRKDFAVLMDNIVKNYISKAGVVTEVKEGSVMINAPGVTLKDVTVKGNLIIGDGVGSGNVTLDNVKVEGATIVRGGGVNSIIIRGSSSLSTIVISKVDGNVRVSVEGNAAVEIVEIADGKDDVLIEGKIEKVTVATSDVPVSIQNATVKEVSITAEKADVTIAKGSKVTTVNAQAANSSLTVAGSVETVNATKTATGTKLEVSKGASVGTVNAAAAKTEIKGEGSVSNANVTADNVKIDTAGTQLKVGEGVSGTTSGGKDVKSGASTTTEGQKPSVDNGGGAPITVPAIAGTFKSTGNIGIAPDSAKEAAGKIYTEYKLISGSKDISLASDNVEYIKVKVGEGDWQSLTANTDTTLWFNVESTKGVRSYEVKTRDGNIYTASLDWQKEIKTAAWNATNREGKHEEKTYVEYKLMDSETPVSLKENEVNLIAQKAGEKWVKLTPNSDETLWFGKDKAAGDYEYIVVTKDNVIYKATLRWTAPAAITWEVSSSTTIEKASRPTALYDGKTYHMWYVAEGKINHKSGDSPQNLANDKQCRVGADSSYKDIDTTAFGDCPCVIKDGEKYYMFIATPSGDAINLYTSSDGNDWTVEKSVLSKGENDAWDAAKIDNPKVIKDGETYKLYYQGKDKGGNYRIGVATCNTINGQYTKSENNPILSASADEKAWDSFRVFQPCVVKDGSNYYMWYAANKKDSKGGPEAIGCAWSTDGIAWTKNADNPVIKESGSLTQGTPTVIKVEGVWHMWYLCGSNINYASCKTVK